MAEKKIPGVFYIVVGAAMVLMSVFINIKNQDNSLTLFILVGAVFIVVGFFKIVIKLDQERKQRERHAKNQAAHAHHQAQHPAQHHTQHAQHSAHQAAHQPQHHAQHPQHAHHSSTSVVRCANCQVKIHPLFQFCPKCGHKLK